MEYSFCAVVYLRACDVWHDHRVRDLQHMQLSGSTKRKSCQMACEPININIHDHAILLKPTIV